MKIISLGYTCYMKSLLNETKYKHQTDVVDWMNTFEFSKIIDCIENDFNICDDLTQSPIDVDENKTTVLYNPCYNMRLPHEIGLSTQEIHEKYQRRYKRFLDYKYSEEFYIYIRIINTGRYNINPENI
ncbi:unnamed protein product, partial [Heterosigma akashiwo]